MRSVVACLALLCVSMTSARCSGPYEDCFNTTCCSSGNFGCKRREHKQYAQCRPMPAQGCVFEKGWECPGWEMCTENYGTCTESKCCKDPSFGCFRRPSALYAQCRPMPQVGTCTDNEEWKCPGWELCSDTYQPCTNTHCCADSRDVCYQKRPFFSQCLRKGTCKAGVDGICEEQRSTLGLCSESFHDCHLTACCQAGEDHCFLKNEGYGKCMPSCDPLANPDWQCATRELPSEKAKVTCEDLRSRNNLFNRMCATQYESAAQCESAFYSHENVYRPCVWKAATRACEESTQVLACDCALMHKDCPVHIAAVRGDSMADGSGDTEGFSSGETLVVTVAILIIIGGCVGLLWFFFGKNASFSSTRKHADEDEDGFMGSTGNKSRNTKRGRGRAEELDTVEEDENL